MSTVVHKKSGRKLSYGQIAKSAKMPDPMPKATKADLKPLNQCRFIGKDLARVDIPLKVNGTAKYGIDTQLPGMLYASVLHRPVQGEKPDKIDDAAAKAVKGVVAVQPLPNGVAVIGHTLEATTKGKAALKVTWTNASPARKWSNESLAAEYTKIAGDKAQQGVDMLKNGDAAGRHRQGEARCCPAISSPITSPIAAWSRSTPPPWSRATRCICGPRTNRSSTWSWPARSPAAPSRTR